MDAQPLKRLFLSFLSVVPAAYPALGASRNPYEHATRPLHAPGRLAPLQASGSRPVCIPAVSLA